MLRVPASFLLLKGDGHRDWSDLDLTCLLVAVFFKMMSMIRAELHGCGCR